MNLHKIGSTLELKVIKSLVQTIFKFIKHAKEMQ